MGRKAWGGRDGGWISLEGEREETGRKEKKKSERRRGWENTTYLFVWLGFSVFVAGVWPLSARREGSEYPNNLNIDGPLRGLFSAGPFA